VATLVAGGCASRAMAMHILGLHPNADLNQDTGTWPARILVRPGAGWRCLCGKVPKNAAPR
jgi:hypothetical protein